MKTISPSPVPARWVHPLSDSTYLRQRLDPPLPSLDHLPLRDLLAVMKTFAAKAGSGVVFDYGCGGSPYRGLFSQCAGYVGADIVAGPTVDRILDATGLTTEPDETYETVLSSQVLEHVPTPSRYLSEAFRILKPGGHLILTTHGMFLEHGCPSDFYRWTGYGLERAAADAGFDVCETHKITPGTRASIYLINLAIENAGTRHHWLPHFAIALFRHLWAVSGRPLSHALADFLDPRASVPKTSPEPLYIGVGLVARKP